MCMHSGQWRLGRRPALDGLRGIAILLVVLYHLRLPALEVAGGPVGVTMFFTLSGFLITSILLAEPGRHVSLRPFYVRRARRLLPALGALLTVWLALDMAVNHQFTETPLVIGALTYSANFVMASGEYLGDSPALGHTWSLAIEEQFYLLWPVALLWLRRFPKPWIIGVTLVPVGISILLRAAAWNAGEPRSYYGSVERLDGLLIGCLLAVMMAGTRVRRAPTWLLPVSLGTAVAHAGIGGGFQAVWAPTVVAVATAGVLYSVSMGRTGVLGAPVLTWLGRRSYGLYLYHPIAIYAVAATVSPGRIAALLLAAPIALIAAEVSWRFVEAPLLRRHVDEVHRAAVRGGGPDGDAGRGEREGRCGAEGDPAGAVDAVERPHVVRPVPS